MSTQGAALSVGNRGMSRVFSGTVTDDQWNTVVSSNSTVNLGLEMPNAFVDSIQATYQAGGMLYRIKDTKTNRISRYGFANKLGFTCAKTSMLYQPVQIKNSDILQVWPIVVNGTSAKTNCLAIVYTSAGAEPFGLNTIANTTDTEILSLESGNMSLGDFAFGSMLKKVCIQLQDAATLNSVTIIDSTGGTVMTQLGGVRGAVGENSGLYNIEFNCNIPIQKGWKIKVNTTK